jgi:hypothetical protein
MPTYIAALTGAEPRTTQSKLGDILSVTDVNGIVADGTDQTSAINAWLATLPADYRGMLLIPYGLKFDVAAVEPNMPVSLIFFDLSMINAWDTSGFRQNTFGFMERGDATSKADMNFAMQSGHHPTFILSNSGTSGSSSGLSRVATSIWAAGRYDAYGQPGLRTVATQQFGKSSFETGRWNHTLRKRAPWAAVEANYNPWEAGRSATAVDTYVFANSKYYVAASTGTTGETRPSHTSGTVSDGGVDWTYVQFGYDGTVYYWDDLGRLGVNGSRSGATWSFRQNVDDSEATAIMQIKPAAAASRTARLRLQGTDAASAYTSTPYLNADSSGNLNFTKSDASTVLAFFSDSGGFHQRLTTKTASNLTSGSTTPSVENIGTLLVQNTAPVTITNFTGGVTDQEFELIAADGNTTLAHGAGIRLAGGVNVALTEFSVVTLRKISVTSAWIEVSRCIK